MTRAEKNKALVPWLYRRTTFRWKCGVYARASRHHHSNEDGSARDEALQYIFVPCCIDYFKLSNKKLWELKVRRLSWWIFSISRFRPRFSCDLSGNLKNVEIWWKYVCAEKRVSQWRPFSKEKNYYVVRSIIIFYTYVAISYCQPNYPETGTFQYDVI